MPVAIFCSITSTILKMGMETLVSVLTIFGTYLFALACMIAVYCLLILLKGRLSPVPLLRKYAPIMLQVFSLAIAKAYGVEITGSAIFSLVITIFVLSMGAPGIPGVGLICLSVLLTQIGIPVEAVGLVMGIDSLVGMFNTMINCLGDVSITTIVAKSEGLIDIVRYKAT